MNTVVTYNVINNNGELLETKSFIVKEAINDAEKALEAAKADYSGDDGVRLQGYLGVTDEELAQETITRTFG